MGGPLLRDKTLQAFAAFDRHLQRPLKLLVAGGAAMNLAYGMPEGTHDVDAVTFQGFDKLEDLKEEIHAVAKELEIPSDWLNPYFGNFAFVLPGDYPNRFREVFQGQNLRVVVLGPEDLLIMKLHAGRPKDDTHIRRLLKTQKIELPLVERHLEVLVKKSIPGSDRALERFEQYLDELGLAI